MTRIFIALLILTSSLMADVKSTTGQIKFDVQSDNQAEMTLNETGLGIGVSPSTNLHINGNAIISNQVFVGGSSGSSNLNVNGTIGYGFQTVTSSTTLSGNSIILVDSSTGNITLSLPEALSYSGRKYTIKKTSPLNSISIRDGGFIDNYSDISLSVNNMGSLSVISSSGNWHILDISGNGTLMVAENLIGWWKFDELSGTTAEDFSGNDKDGTLTGGFSFSGNAGHIGSGLTFSGNNDHVSIPLFDSNTWSCSVWMNLVTPINTAPPQYGLATIISGDSATQLIGVYNTKVVLYTTTLVNYAFDSNPGWHHVVVTYDGTNLRAIVDSSTSGSVIATNPLDGGVSRYIGARDGNNAHIFDGTLDDVRIYDRVLTDDEIEALYLQGQ